MVKTDPSLVTAPALLDFYTISMADLEAAGAPEGLRTGRPRYPIPVALIARLAVDARRQGLRVGERILADAISRIVLGSQQTACPGVIMHAENELAVGVYLNYGFTLLEPESVLPVGELDAAPRALLKPPRASPGTRRR